MKLLTPIFSFLLCISIYSQETDTQELINNLTQKIKQSDRSEKLKWMDSLTTAIRYKKEFNYDSVVKQTISYAFQLDSVTIASSHIADRIFYLANRAGKPNEAVRVFDDFIKKRPVINRPDILAQLYLNGADGYFFSGKTKESISFYQSAGAYALEAKDSILLGKSKIYTSDAYADGGQFAEAGLILVEAETIFEKLKDTTNLLTTFNSRANLYSRIGFFKEAQQVREELIKLATPRKDYRILQSTYYNIAIDNRKTNDYKSRIQNLNKALKNAELGNYKSYQMRILISLLQAYSFNNNTADATRILHLIQEHPYRPKDGGLDNFHYLEALANYHLVLGNNNRVIDYGKTLLKLDARNDFGNSMDTHNLLATAYDNIENSEKSYEHFKVYSRIRDSIYKIQNIKSLTYYQTLYETKKRDAKIQSQQSEIVLLDTKNKVKTQWMLFGGLGLLSLFLAVYFIRSYKFLKKRQALQELFAHELIKGQEEEKTRLARELHDSVGQKLMLLNKKTKQLEIPDIESLTKNTLEELRSISRGLYPANIEKLGITAAIESMINEVDAHTNIFFTNDIANIDEIIDKETSIHLFRIIQETLNNVVKHANAKAVSVVIEKNDHSIKAIVKDNGKGFELSKKIKQATSIGMKTLTERAKIIHSFLDIESTPNRGTTLQLIIPK
ncbi:tetratricopeptide repeat-containing sensor histidine kinase [Aquimarina litoralis]|uniref:tetratricopeptide repeat-containing sensor histidine kinase n=1 Tax=Aquimarina litoralis TaxID=584605 RepID=UPI001C57A5D8|nr:sensor histidine kinase [Aquimarina litoralis]MBW1294199.1 hypothetical protein [Aquimarina litoralis]